MPITYNILSSQEVQRPTDWSSTGIDLPKGYWYKVRLYRPFDESLMEQLSVSYLRAGKPRAYERLAYGLCHLDLFTEEASAA
jgi:hypothetical protein